jgi:hypothetical protein
MVYLLSCESWLVCASAAFFAVARFMTVAAADCLVLPLSLLLQGNVGRFLNHSCSPNCLVQTVFAGNARWVAW